MVSLLHMDLNYYLRSMLATKNETTGLELSARQADDRLSHHAFVGMAAL